MTLHDHFNKLGKSNSLATLERTRTTTPMALARPIFTAGGRMKRLGDLRRGYGGQSSPSSDALLRFGVQKHWLQVGTMPQPKAHTSNVRCLCALRDSAAFDEWSEKQGWNPRFLHAPRDSLKCSSSLATIENEYTELETPFGEEQKEGSNIHSTTGRNTSIVLASGASMCRRTPHVNGRTARNQVHCIFHWIEIYKHYS
jgi:hypothetical protein